MVICLLVTAGATCWAFAQYRKASNGFAALGPGIFMLGARIIGGLTGMMLAIVAIWRGEPGRGLLWAGLFINLMFAVPSLSRITKRFLRERFRH